MPIAKAPRTEGPVPATGILGVAGVAGAVQVVLSGYEGFLQTLSRQTSEPVQSALTEQVSLHEDAYAISVDVGVGVAVLVGVAVGVWVGVAVLVGVAVGVPVGVAVGVPVGVGVPVCVGVGVLVGLLLLLLFPPPRWRSVSPDPILQQPPAHG